jgi:hypothetical protein
MRDEYAKVSSQSRDLVCAFHEGKTAITALLTGSLKQY